MSRRIEIELTSARGDASFTWRAAGARQPKGVVAASMLPPDAGIGDRFRVELDTGLDGSEITQVIPDRAPRSGEPEHLKLLGEAVPDEALVTSRLVGRSKGRGTDDKRSRPRRDGPGGHRPRENAGGQPKRGDRPQRDDRNSKNTKERTTRAKRPAQPRPKTPRLRPGRVHRQAFLGTLPDEQQPVAEKLLHGGLPTLRQAIAEDNVKRRAQGQPEVPADGLITMAEKILPRLQDAEWHDRADAALAAVDVVDLRDLRSVVVAADDHARTDETRRLSADLRARLAQRVETAHAEWLAELDKDLTEKRLARVLNSSSRPPKAGSPLPTPLAARMIQATNEALAPASASGRWVALLDALAYAPIRHKVVPVGIPEEPSAELLAQVHKLASRLPAVAGAFGVGASASDRGEGSGAKQTAK